LVLHGQVKLPVVVEVTAGAERAQAQDGLGPAERITPSIFRASSSFVVMHGTSHGAIAPSTLPVNGYAALMSLVHIRAFADEAPAPPPPPALETAPAVPRPVYAATPAAPAPQSADLTVLGRANATGVSPTEAVVSMTAAPRRNTLTVNPLALATGALNAELEFSTSTSTSIFVGPSYYGMAVVAEGREARLGAFGLQAGLRLFRDARAPRGLWFGPQLEAAVASVSDSRVGYGVAVGTTAGATVGHTWITSSNFAISIGFGAGYRRLTMDLGDTRIDASGAAVMLRLSLGLAL
jgi:hypothetical protein